MIKKTVLLCGGVGRLERHYRDAAGKEGWALIYYEHHPGSRVVPQVDLVLLVAGCSSHPLRHYAERVARMAGCKMVEINRGVGSMRKALAA